MLFSFDLSILFRFRGWVPSGISRLAAFVSSPLASVFPNFVTVHGFAQYSFINRLRIVQVFIILLL